MAMETLRNVIVTKGGWPALWERGGALTSRGFATIILEPDGSKPRPIVHLTRGHLASGNHALVGLRAGMYVIEVGAYKGAITSITITRIVRVGVKNGDAIAEVEEVNSFIPTTGEWSRPLEQKFLAAIEAAVDKAQTWHCRHAVWVDGAAKQKFGPGRRQLAAIYDQIQSDRRPKIDPEELADWERELLFGDAS